MIIFLISLRGTLFEPSSTLRTLTKLFFFSHILSCFLFLKNKYILFVIDLNIERRFMRISDTRVKVTIYITKVHFSSRWLYFTWNNYMLGDLFEIFILNDERSYIWSFCLNINSQLINLPRELTINVTFTGMIESYMIYML